MPDNFDAGQSDPPSKKQWVNPYDLPTAKGVDPSTPVFKNPFEGLPDTIEKIPQPEPDFLTQVGNVISNIGALSSVVPNSKGMALMVQIAKANAGNDAHTAMGMSLDKLSHIEDFTKDNIINPVLSGISNSIKHLPTALMGLPAGVLSMVTQPVAALSGVDITKNNPQAMTPEERSQAITGTVATMAMVLATGGVTKALGTIGKAEVLGVGTPLSELQAISRPSLGKSIATTMAKGYIEGAAGGLTYGARPGPRPPARRRSLGRRDPAARLRHCARRARPRSAPRRR